MENDARDNEEVSREANFANVPEVEQAAPSPVWPGRAPDDVKPKVTPDSVKLAAALVIAHGVLTSLSAFQGGRNAGDLSGLPMALVWLGVTIVLGGALTDRQVWSWWVTTFVGGFVGIFNLLRVIAYGLATIGDMFEKQVKFSPLLVGIAGILILIAVALLAIPEAKAAFSTEPTPWQPTRPPARPDDFDFLEKNDDSH